MPTWGLSAITLGSLWLCLWKRPWRWFGLAGIVGGLAGMLAASIPDLLVDGSGRLLAVRTADGGLLFSSKTVGRSTREAWLRYAGEAAPAGTWPKQGESPLAPLRCDSLGCVYRVDGRDVAIARRGEALVEDCRRADAIVSLVPVPRACPSAETVVDRFDLWRDGGHALWIGTDGIRVESVEGRRGERPWTAKRASRNTAVESNEDDDED
jgi:competence protein ComEC